MIRCNHSVNGPKKGLAMAVCQQHYMCPAAFFRIPWHAAGLFITQCIASRRLCQSAAQGPLAYPDATHRVCCKAVISGPWLSAQRNNRNGQVKLRNNELYSVNGPQSAVLGLMCPRECACAALHAGRVLRSAGKTGRRAAPQRQAPAEREARPDASRDAARLCAQGGDWNGQVKLGNNEFYGVNYLQSVTPHLALGGEAFWLGQQRKSGAGFAARHADAAHVATCQVATTGLVSLTYLQKVSEKVRSPRAQSMRHQHARRRIAWVRELVNACSLADPVSYPASVTCRAGRVERVAHAAHLSVPASTWPARGMQWSARARMLLLPWRTGTADAEPRGRCRWRRTSCGTGTRARRVRRLGMTTSCASAGCGAASTRMARFATSANAAARLLAIAVLAYQVRVTGGGQIALAGHWVMSRVSQGVCSSS